jgi:hypothetical protein
MLESEIGCYQGTISLTEDFNAFHTSPTKSLNSSERLSPSSLRFAPSAAGASAAERGDLDVRLAEAEAELEV